MIARSDRKFAMANDVKLLGNIIQMQHLNYMNLIQKPVSERGKCAKNEKYYGHNNLSCPQEDTGKFDMYKCYLRLVTAVVCGTSWPELPGYHPVVLVYTSYSKMMTSGPAFESCDLPVWQLQR